MGYTDLCLHFASIGREIIDIIVLGCDLCTIIVKLFTHRPPERLTKVPPVTSKSGSEKDADQNAAPDDYQQTVKCMT